MATVYCDNCGTSLLEETSKFCRACGKPTPLSEAATKRFDEPTVVKHPTSPVGSYTTPAYMAPFEMPPAEQTNDLRQKKQKRNLIIMASMMAVMIVALAGLLCSSGSERDRKASPRRHRRQESRRRPRHPRLRGSLVHRPSIHP